MVTALLLSGGTGTRMGTETPKQYIKVNDRPIIAYCLDTILSHKRCFGGFGERSRRKIPGVFKTGQDEAAFYFERS